MAEVAATIAALVATESRVNEAVRQATADVLHLLQAAIMENAPVGTPGNSTNAPGDLRRSVLVDGPHLLGPGAWAGQVGPTMVYSRQRELGGPIFPKRAAMLRFTKFGVVYYRDAVFQHRNPYTKRGYEAVLPSAEGVYEAHVAAALGG